MLKKITILLFVLFISVNNSFTQQMKDTVNKEANRNITGYEMTKSPTGALWRSVIPGWGQLYNEEYWKAPILFSAAVTLTGMIVYYNNNFQDYTDRLESATDPNSKILIDNSSNANDEYFLIEKQVLSSRELQQLKSNREFNRNNRDLSAFYLLGVYVISAVDAYVGAHLYDFDVDENIGLGTKILGNGVPVVYLSYSF